MHIMYNIIDIRRMIMPKKSIILLPETMKILEQMGAQIKYARLRRKLSAELVAERAIGDWTVGVGAGGPLSG